MNFLPGGNGGGLAPPSFLSLALDLGESLAVERCMLASEVLPAFNRDLAIAGVNLNRERLACRHLGSNDRRARSDERVIDEVSQLAVVLDWAFHALDRLLRAVTVPRILSRFYRPQRGLRSSTVPAVFGVFSNRIPTRFVLPMIIATGKS